ncbi:MAG: tol-pal system YbgF family protein [Kofleriaceae bacterium]
MRALAIAVVVVIPVSAWANDAKQKATQHIEKATALHNQGKFAEALVEMKTAYALDPRPELLYAMGQLHVRLGECDKAITYYERYLTTKPKAATASIAREAIETCRSNPPPAVVTPEPAPTSPPEPITPPPPPAPTRTIVTQAPWYTDYLGDALVGGGVIAGAIGGVMYVSARGARDDADTATTYNAYEAAIDRAQRRQTYSLVLTGIGVGLMGAGVARYLLGDRSERQPSSVRVTAGANGAMITWTVHR